MGVGSEGWAETGRVPGPGLGQRIGRLPGLVPGPGSGCRRSPGWRTGRFAGGPRQRFAGRTMWFLRSQSLPSAPGATRSKRYFWAASGYFSRSTSLTNMVRGRHVKAEISVESLVHHHGLPCLRMGRNYDNLIKLVLKMPVKFSRPGYSVHLCPSSLPKRYTLNGAETGGLP